MSLGGALTRRLPTSLLVLGLVARGVGLFLVACVRFPALGCLVVLAGVSWWLLAAYGPGAVAAALLLGLLALAVVLAAWSWLGPHSFEAHLVGPVRSLRRRRYYGPRWDEAMLGCSLTRAEYVPVVMSVRAGATVDELLVHMAPGQLVTDWRDAANRLAAALEVRSVRVRREGPRDVLLLVRHSAVSWRESREAVEAEVDEVVGQLPAHEALHVEAERIVAELPEPTEVHDVRRPGEGRAFPRRPR